MKSFIAKIWVPVVLVMIAAVQSFGIDAGRAVSMRRMADSLMITMRQDSAYLDAAIADSLGNDTIAVIAARDTIVVPDSLKETDPFFYKYYIAVKDSLTRAQVRDSLIQANDSITLHKLDSLYLKDSTEVAKAKFDAWYKGLSRKERKKYDAEQALPGLIAASLRKMEIKDSIKAHRDSVRESIPRVLETFAFPDSLQYKRIVTWKHDRDFHNMVELREQWQDTSYNVHFFDYPFMRQDVGVSWLGVAGSPVEPYNYFKRKTNQDAPFFTPYQFWSFTPEDLPNYNTKTPYVELAYWGTLFANQDKEESDVKVLVTQNITPELNLTLQYTNFSGRGMLPREGTKYRTFLASTNYVGKKYLMHAGYIYNRIERSENGGLIDQSMIRDTTVDAREIDVYLKEASSMLRTNTVYLDQSYRIPFNFIEKLKGRKERKAEKARRDSIMASGDSVAIEALKSQMEAELAKEQEKADTATLDKDITSAFIGHSSEYAVFRRSYSDKINDDFGKQS